MTTRWLSVEEQRAWRAYIESTKALMDALDRQLQGDADMPHAYYQILARLSEADERSMRMSELADRTLSSRSRVSHAIARLEERGWVTRAASAADRRGQIATLTDLGFDALRSAAPGHVEAVRRFVIDPLDAEQLRQLTDISDTILASVHRAEPAPPATS